MPNNETRDAILQALASIPEGHICSYGMVAKLAGVPGHARYVGYILKHLPSPTSIPWHRIVNSRGQSSFTPGSDEYKLQVMRLQQEGVDISGDTDSSKPLRWFGI